MAQNNRDKQIQIWMPTLLGTVMAVGMFFGFKMRDGMRQTSFFNVPAPSPIQEMLTLINNKYVDSVNMKKLSDTAIYSILEKLDPHSIYIPAKDLEKSNEEITGSFYGIGVEYSMYDDTIQVVNVLNDGPASKAGLVIGDKIIKINDSQVAGVKAENEVIRNLMRGSLNSVVNLTVKRGTKQIVLPVVRGIIPLKSIDAFYMVNDSVGYIRINLFSTQTYREFMEALTSLKKNNMRSLIIDLRDNGGGVLEEAVEIADEFLSGEKLITYTQGAHFKKEEYRSRRTGQFEEGKVVLLANEGTASASEILLGALQDWDRAIVVGRRTFGKGLVQEQFNLSDRSAMRLTVARYFTPLGRSIQRSYANGSKEYYHEITQRYTSGENYYADSAKSGNGKIYTTPAGKKIYGGGGISPDYFVGADTSSMGVVTAKLYSKGILEDFGYKYFLENPSLAKTYTSAADFTKRFAMTDKEWNFLGTLAAKANIDVKNISETEKNRLALVLKSGIARQLYRTEGYYEVMNSADNTVKKALEILN